MENKSLRHLETATRKNEVFENTMVTSEQDVGANLKEQSKAVNVMRATNLRIGS